MGKKRLKPALITISIIASIILTGFVVQSEAQEYIFDLSLRFVLNNLSSAGLEINIANPPNGNSNPLNFEFNISSNNIENLGCNFYIDTNPLSDNLENKSIKQELSNGQHNWVLNCTDLTNPSIESVSIGNFSINENFSASISKKVYLIDGAGNLIGGTGNLQASSTQNAGITIRIVRPSLQVYQETAQTPYSKTIDSTIIREKGNYTAETIFNRTAEPISINNTFSVAQASLSFSQYEADANEEVTITADLYSPIGKITSAILDFGDGNSNISYTQTNFNSKIINFKHRYTQSGNYTASIIINIEENSRSQTFEVTKKGIYIEDSRDREDPTVTLISPASGEEIKTDTITFSYKAEDNVKIKNCTFELYNYTGGIGALDYFRVDENLVNDKTMEISLKDFEEGNYSWNVYCCDNSSNCNGDLEYYRKFKVSFNSSLLSSTSKKENESYYEKKEEVTSLLAKIEEFIEKQASYGADEKEALEDLGITQDLDTNLKILKQIDQDLGGNIALIKDEALKEKTKEEKEAQIEEIKAKVPIGIKIVGKHEFVKNSAAKDMEGIVQDYTDAKGIKADSRTVKKMAELNKDLQNELVVSTVVKQIDISYLDRTDEITLITKKIELKNNTFNTLLEIVPKEVAENASDITFITPNEVIKEDPIFAISVDDLENGRIIYYVKKSIDAKKIEDTETLLFKEFTVNNQITGFAILDLGGSSLVYYLLLIFLVIVVAYLVWFYLRKRKIARWKKEENVMRIFAYIKEANRALEKKDVIVAKENYHKIQQVYPLIPEGCKRYLLKKIRYIRVEIDKKEILTLVKEFETAKAEKRSQDAELLYKKIQPIYKRLPKKYRQRVHEKLVI